MNDCDVMDDDDDDDVDADAEDDWIGCRCCASAELCMRVLCVFVCVRFFCTFSQRHGQKAERITFNEQQREMGTRGDRVLDTTEIWKKQEKKFEERKLYDIQSVIHHKIYVN